MNRSRAASAAALVLCGFAAVASAQTPGTAQTSLEVSPLRVEVKLAASGSHTEGISLTNTGRDAIRVRATISDWHLTRDGAPQFEGPEPGRKYAASEWMRLAPPELVIQPGATSTVRFTLAVPPGTEAATYRTGILFDLSPTSGDIVTARRQVAVRSRIATLVYVTVGDTPATVDLTDLRSRVAPDGTSVVATLKNTSRRSVRTKGSVRVLTAAGALVKEVVVPDVPVLPESERDVAIVVGDAAGPLVPGEYRIEVRIDVGLPALLVGETALKVGR